MKRISLIGGLTLAAACIAGYGLPAAAQTDAPSSSPAPMAAPAETPPPIEWHGARQTDEP